MSRTGASLTLALMFLAATCLTLPYSVNAAPRTIVVPDDYPTIALAIDNAANGDTIIVKRGNYTENPFAVNKSISIIGEDAKNTVVTLVEKLLGYYRFLEYELASYDYGIQINASNVTVSNLTIANPLSYPTSHDSYKRSLKVAGSNIKVTGNIISDLSGLNFNGSNILIAENNLAGDIVLYGSYATIVLNNVTNTSNVVYGSNNNATLNNLVKSSLNLEGSLNTIHRNKISGSLYVGGSENEVTDNEVTGEGITIWGTSYSRNSIISSRNSVINNNFNGTGITLRETRNSILANNSFNEGGITLQGSSGNVIDNNDVLKGGIALGALDLHETIVPCSENTVKRNSILNGSGFHLGWGVNNKFFANRVENCSSAFYFFISDANSGTVAYHNNFINNNQQFTEDGYGFSEGEDLFFYFDDGKEGNYWSDYKGADLDNDGICDSPNVLLAWQNPGDEKPTNFTVIDRYPLMLPFDTEDNKIIIPPPALDYSLLVVLLTVTVAVALCAGAGLLLYFKKKGSTHVVK